MQDKRFLAAIAFFLVALYFDVVGTSIGTSGFTGGTEGDVVLAAMYDRFGRWMILMPIVYFVTVVYFSCLLRYASRRGHIRIRGVTFLSLLMLTTAGAGNLLGGTSRLVPAWESFHQTLFYGNFLASLDPTWFLWRYALSLSLGAAIAVIIRYIRFPSRLIRPRTPLHRFSKSRGSATAQG